MSRFSDILAFYHTEQSRLGHFFSYIISQLRVVSSKSIEMMAVGIRDRRLTLFVNPEWVENTTVLDVLDTLDHEGAHIINCHLSRIYDVVDDSLLRRPGMSRCVNIAVDLAANAFLKPGNHRIRSPEWWVPTERPYEDHKMEWTFEEHLAKLLDNPPDTTSSPTHIWLLGTGLASNPFEGDTLDQSSSQCISGSIAAEILEHTRVLVAQAKDEYSKQHGPLPGHFQELVEVLLAPPRIDWKAVMRNLASGSILSSKRRSMSRPYRRHLGVKQLSWYPGRSTDRTFNIVFGIDTSGSMGAKELGQALGILQKLQRIDPWITITIIESDADVQRVYTITGTDDIKVDLCGRGGTCFDPAIEEARKYRPDLMFYYTDGCAGVPKSRLACPMVWLISPHGSNPSPGWGHCLFME